MGLGFIEHVKSAVLRNKGDFQGAFNAAKKSLVHLPEEPHVHIQYGLTALRLGLKEEAKTYFEQAAELAAAFKKNKPEYYDTDTHQRFISAEKDPLERALLNLAQVYNQLGVYQMALDCFDKVEEPVQLENPLQVAYKNNVMAEAYIGLKQYDEANERLLTAYNNYESEDALDAPNCFRTRLGLLETVIGLEETLGVETLEDARAHHQRLGCGPTHDFTVRLDAITTSLEHLDGLAVLGM